MVSLEKIDLNSCCSALYSEKLQQVNVSIKIMIMVIKPV